MSWIIYPFARITPMLTIGILLKDLIGWPGRHWLIGLLFLLVLLSFYLFIFNRSYHAKKNIFPALAALISFIIVGFISAQLNYVLNRPGTEYKHQSAKAFYIATIISRPSATPKSIKYKASIESIKKGDLWFKAQDEVILYFKSKLNPEFNYGDRLIVKGNPTLHKNQKNPYAFDYALYLQRQGIYFQDFLSEGEFISIDGDRGISLGLIVFEVGAVFENVLAEYVSSEKARNLMKAMLLGRRDEISPEMEYAYAATGTSHILAVSGLHIGIIYLIFSTLFNFLKYGKSKWLYYVLVAISLWSFAIITGLSPSAQRASIMFTFILAGKLLSRNNNIYNSILASAFFILLFSPNLIYSVSFQLSYAAVFGIVYLYKKIYNLIYVQNKVINFFWQITVLSISAQIATFPITIYYFHQFPLLFPFTNLVAIPTAIVVIISGILILVTSGLGPIPVIIGKFVEGWVIYYNDLMTTISSLNFALIGDLYLKPVYVFIIILCVILILQFLNQRKLIYFKSFTIIIVLFTVFVLLDNYSKSDQRSVTIYHINNKFYFDIFDGYSCYTNMIASNNKKTIIYNVIPNRKRHLIKDIKGLNNAHMVKKIGESTLIYWEGKTILILRDEVGLTKATNPLKIDYLIIGDNSIRDLNTLAKKLIILNIIIDQTNSRTLQEKILQQSKDLNIETHSIEEDGAYSITI